MKCMLNLFYREDQEMKKFNSTIEIITYIASSTTVDTNKKMSCNYPTYTKKGTQTYSFLHTITSFLAQCRFIA